MTTPTQTVNVNGPLPPPANTVPVADGTGQYNSQPFAFAQGQANSFAYTGDGSPPNNGVYGIWSDLVAAIQTVKFPRVYILNTVTIPVGTWQMNGAILLSGAIVPDEVAFLTNDGTTFINLYGFDGGLAILFNNSAQPGLTWDGALGPFPALYCGNGDIENDGAAAVITLAPGGALFIWIANGSFTPKNPIVDAGANGTVITIVTQTLLGGLGNGWIIGGAGSSLQYITAVDFVTPVIAGFTGTVTNQQSADTINILYEPGNPANWSPVPSELQAAVDQLAARAPVGASSNVFTYDQGSPDNPSLNFYGDWANLIAAIQNTQSPQIWYANANQTIPAGVWQMNRATILCDTYIENPNPWTLTADDGTTLNNLYSLASGAVLIFQNTAVDGLTWDATFGNIPALLLSGLGSTLQKVPGTVDPVHVLNGGFFVLVCEFGSGVIGSGEAVVNLDAGAFMYCFTELRVSLADGWIEGAGFLVYAAGPDFVAPNILPAFTGTQFAQSTRLTTIDGGTTTPGHSFVMDFTSGLYRDSGNGFIGISTLGVLSQEWSTDVTFGSIWVFNGTAGGLVLQDDTGRVVARVVASTQVIQFAIPILGDDVSLSPYGVHGLAEVDAGGGDYVLLPAEYQMDTIFVISAGTNVIHLPAAPTLAGSYKKTVLTLGGTCQVADTDGNICSVILPPGGGADFLFTVGSVVALAQFTPTT